MKNILLGIDIGTSACKVAAFHMEGHVLAQSARSYPVYYPAPGWAEQNPDEWWREICLAIAETLSKGRIQADRIAGIGVDGQSWSCIPVDQKGNVLHNTPMWTDTRSASICERVIERIGFDAIFKVSGNSFEPTYTTPKILWVKENKPHVHRNTYKYLQSNSFVVMKLTGKFSQDLSQGYGLHAFDIAAGRYDDAMCERMGISREQLPELFSCHEIVGEVTKEAAQLTGLIPGIPVVAGGLDACCGTLGAGVMREGQTQEQGGQAGGMSICLDKPISHPRLILGYHVVPGKWLLQGGTVGGGGSIKWLKQELGGYEAALEAKTGQNAFQIMDDEASTIPPGSNGVVFLPYMSGERSPLWDKDAKGVFFGLSYDKTRAHMIRSVLEGCAYALLHNLETASEAGVSIDSLVSVGGAANSVLWTQIKSDVTGKPIDVSASDTASTLGVAILAGIGTGLYKSFEAAASQTVEVTRRHEPNPGNHLKYKQYYAIYRELYEQLKDTMKKCAII